MHIWRRLTVSKTKIFLKYFHVEQLETIVALHHKLGNLLQSCMSFFSL